MELAIHYNGRYGLNQTLAALRISKGTWHYRRHVRRSLTEKYADLRKPLLEIAKEHPQYGYRKVTKELGERGWPVNKKVVQNLQKAWDLPLLRSIRRPATSRIRKALTELGGRINLVPTLKKINPLCLLYTDITELPFDRGDQKAYLMTIIDHVSKYALGWAVGRAKDTTLALAAWKRAYRNLRRFRIVLRKVVIHHDQDAIYTSQEWLRKVCVQSGARVSYSLNGARGNTAMESFNGHFKGENESIFWEQKDIKGVIKVVETRMRYYNDIRRHESLGQISPESFLIKHGIKPQ